jgi:hypothetical protein
MRLRREPLAILWLFSSWNPISSFTTLSRSSVAYRVDGQGRNRRLLVSKEDLNGVPPSPLNEEQPSGSTAQTEEHKVILNEVVKPKASERQHRLTYLPRKAVKIYSEYASRLWRETSPESRRKIAKDKVTQSIRQVQHIFRGDEYSDVSKVSQVDRQNLLDACDHILMDADKAITVDSAGKSVATGGETSGQDGVGKKKKGRSVLFGAMMGLACACWVFSGNYIFTGLFTLMTILGELEYYRMVMNTGVYPARRLSVIGAASMFLTVRKLSKLSLRVCIPSMYPTYI